MNWQEAWIERERIGCEDAFPLPKQNTGDVTPKDDAESVLSCRKMWRTKSKEKNPPICALVNGGVCPFK